jgi:hypothetical protein
MTTTRCDIISVSYTSERKSFVIAVAALLDGRNDNVADPRLSRAKQAATEMAFRRDVLADYASGVHRYDRASVVQGNAMTDDITHNLTVVREALEAEGLGMHVKLIDMAIEDVAGLRAQIANAKKALTEIAALAHRWKWQFDLSEDQKLNGAQTRNLITQGFDSLHRLGDQALKSRDSLNTAQGKSDE